MKPFIGLPVRSIGRTPGSARAASPIIGSKAHHQLAAGASRIPTETALGAGSWRARGFLELPGIEEGAPADLVAYERNPVEDLEILSTPALIVLDGNVIRSPEGMPAR